MKYCIRIYHKGGFGYLWHKDKNARNPESPAELEEQQ